MAIRFAAALLQLQVVCAGRPIFNAESGRKTWTMDNGPFCLPMHALLMRPSGSLRLMHRATEIFPRSYLFSFCFFFFFPHNQFWGTQRTGRSWSRLRSFLARLDMSCLVRSREINGLFLWGSFLLENCCRQRNLHFVAESACCPGSFDGGKISSGNCISYLCCGDLQSRLSLFRSVCVGFFD